MPVESDRTHRLVHSRERVMQEVKQIVGEHMNIAPEQIQESSHLENDLGCDSLDVVEITMKIEEHFDITVPDDLGQQIQTIGSITDGVLQLLEQTQAH